MHIIVKHDVFFINEQFGHFKWKYSKTYTYSTFFLQNVSSCCGYLPTCCGYQPVILGNALCATEVVCHVSNVQCKGLQLPVHEAPQRRKSGLAPWFDHSVILIGRGEISFLSTPLTPTNITARGLSAPLIVRSGLLHSRSANSNGAFSEFLGITLKNSDCTRRCLFQSSDWSQCCWASYT